METHPEVSEFDPAISQADRAIAWTDPVGGAPKTRPPELTVVTRAALSLGVPAADGVPAAWAAAIDRLARWLDLTIEQVAQRPKSGLRHVTAWAAAARSATHAPAAPTFAPWLSWSPVALQHPSAAALPRASWIGSYLHDHGTGKPNSRTAVDIQLLSPLPAACLPDDAEDAPLPRPDVLQAMIEAAQREGRDKVAIVTDARRRNAMIRRMLLLDRSVTRDLAEIDVMTVEDHLCELVRHPARWDAIIVLPDLRSLVFALLAEITGIRTPWPMVWHHRTVSMVSSESLDDRAADLPLNAPLLIESLALAASHAGFSLAAQRLAQGAARLWDCGIVTPGRGSVAPYVTEVSHEDFIDQLCRGVAKGQRTVPRWRALTPDTPARAQREPAHLRVVASN